jgi:hypothetical protein
MSLNKPLLSDLINKEDHDFTVRKHTVHNSLSSSATQQQPSPDQVPAHTFVFAAHQPVRLLSHKLETNMILSDSKLEDEGEGEREDYEG